MNWLYCSLLSVLCTGILLSYCSETVKGAVNSQDLFTFDLSNLKQSKAYKLQHNLNFSTTTSVLEPVEGKKLTKLVDGHENVATFLNDQLVTKVVFSPSVNPSLLSVTYIKGSALYTRRFRKMFGWNEITVDDYNYLMFELSRTQAEVTMDVQNLDLRKFTVRREKYSKYELLNVTVPKAYNVTRVMNGHQLVWESNNEEKLNSAFVSTDSTPAMLCISVSTGNVMRLRTYTNFNGVFNEVNMSEFRFVLQSFMAKMSKDAEDGAADSKDGPAEKTLDLTDLDVSEIQKKVNRVMVDGYELWASTGTSRCLNVAYTVESEPRLYNVLVSEETEGKTKDRFLYFMRENGTFYSLPEVEYQKKVAELAQKGRTVMTRPVVGASEVFDLDLLAKKLGKEDLRTLKFTPTYGTRVSTVVSGKDLVWVGSSREKLDHLYFFKTGNTNLVQLVVTDANNSPSTKFFMYEEHSEEEWAGEKTAAVDSSKVDSATYTKVGGKPQYRTYTKNEAKSESMALRTKPGAPAPGPATEKVLSAYKWLWVSSPLFYSNVAHVQLVKNYVSVDVEGKLNRGVLYHKKGSVGRVFVRTYTTYPSNSVTSLFDSEKCMWTASENEEALSVCLFEPREADPKHEVKGERGQPLEGELKKLAELYVKVGDKVRRVFLASDGKRWEKVDEEDFKLMYNKL
ncbi:conserved hypothetical protein [Theileria orientalis strain Shintoku]|uniref:Signal peptide containing protein n=1 Tax=Theileria orientalis strain Shintoku TaxID=869250 RepID=J4C3J5_THEOR|nr:conserved hypothetical protein [Theileria orientalis strain Shintoku]BAM40551.1 conserved hypothetical protein [Theileria orientalis strain Shintoku]|eukprot:XP_009690852.1 conserved hypothetical protein [Theileria orientalis strain Shintoku]